eukprot:gene10096-7993_t
MPWWRCALFLFEGPRPGGGTHCFFWEGHALVAVRTVAADPVHEETTVPQRLEYVRIVQAGVSLALGMVNQLPDEDQTSISLRQMLARLDVCMGGRVAEEIVFGPESVTTGASSDLKQATALARAMVTKYGMSSRLGQVSMDYEDDGRSMSSETRAIVEEEVKLLLEAAYERARTILNGHMDELHMLAKELLEKETMSGNDIKVLLGMPTTATASPTLPGGPSGILLPGIGAMSQWLSALRDALLGYRGHVPVAECLERCHIRVLGPCSSG